MPDIHSIAKGMWAVAQFVPYTLPKVLTKLTIGLGETVVQGVELGLNKVRNYSLDTIRAENWSKLQAQRNEKLGFTSDVDFSSTAFKGVVDKRVKDVQGFSAAIKDKLTGSTPNAALIKNAIAESLQESFDGFAEEQQTFENEMASFKELACEKILINPVTNQPVRLTVEKITLSYYARAQRGRDAIKARRDAEIAALGNKFDKPDVKDALLAELKDEAGIQAFKKSMTDELTASYDKHLEAFDKSISDSLVKIHDAANKESASLDWIHYQKEHGSDEMKKIIEEEEIELAKVKSFGKTRAINDDEDDPYQVELTRLKKLVGLYGAEYKKKGEDTYEMNLCSLMSVIKYNTPFYPRKKELINLARLVMALGYKGIEVTVDFPSPCSKEANEERAREAYEAIIEAGVDPKYIVIHFMGKKLTHDAKDSDSDIRSIFKGKESEFSTLQDHSKEVRAKITPHPKEKRELDKAISCAKFKEENKVIIQKLEQKAKQKAATPAGGATPGLGG